MIGAGPNGSRPVNPATQARLTEFALLASRVAVLTSEAGLQLVALWQFPDDPAPRITANQFVTDGTAAELRLLADHLDAVLAGGRV